MMNVRGVGGGGDRRGEERGTGEERRGGALSDTRYTEMCRQTGYHFSSPSSRTVYGFWPWTVGLGIIFALNL